MTLLVPMFRVPRTMMIKSSGLPPELRAASSGLIDDCGCRFRSPSKNSQVVAPAFTVMTSRVPRLADW
ncbi:hypothetical protein D3C84_1131970 [compost metagenome]